MGEVVASHMSHYTSLVEVASLALGDGGDDKSPSKEPITEDLSGAAPEHFLGRLAALTRG
jgi:hypothetical protein